MSEAQHSVRLPDRAFVEARVLALAEETAGHAAGSLHARSTFVEVFDSLDQTDFLLRTEAEFHVSIMPPFTSPPARDIEARRPFTIGDFVDLIFAQWGQGWSDGAECPHCAYPLRGLECETCPECGRRIGRPGGPPATA